jgi:hypothetical protein
MARIKSLANSKSKGKRWRQHSCLRGGNEMRVERSKDHDAGARARSKQVWEGRWRRSGVKFLCACIQKILRDYGKDERSGNP